MSNKEAYIAFCASHPDVPLFLQPWWLDAVTKPDGKEWEVLLARDKNGEIEGVMPYLLRKRACFKYIVMPQQTQLSGILVRPDIAANQEQTFAVCQQIAEQLSQMGLAYYYQQYQPASPCVDAMCTLGFKTRERVTYRVEDLSDLEAVVASFSKNKRRQLQKANNLHVEKAMTAAEFYQFHVHCLSARKRNISYSQDLFAKIERESRSHNQSQIISICDGEGKTYAAAFLVWDKKILYYLIPTYDPAFGDSGAGALLVLEAMKQAKEKHLRFDFEGSMNKGIAMHYRQFGSSATTYYSVEKYYNPLFHLAMWLQRIREKRTH